VFVIHEFCVVVSTPDRQSNSFWESEHRCTPIHTDDLSAFVIHEFFVVTGIFRSIYIRCEIWIDDTLSWQQQL